MRINITNQQKKTSSSTTVKSVRTWFWKTCIYKTGNHGKTALAERLNFLREKVFVLELRQLILLPDIPFLHRFSHLPWQNFLKWLTQRWKSVVPVSCSLLPPRVSCIKCRSSWPSSQNQKYDVGSSLGVPWEAPVLLFVPSFFIKSLLLQSVPSACFEWRAIFCREHLPE